MIKIRLTGNDKIIQGSDWKDMLNQLQNDTQFSGITSEQYMEGVSLRAKVFCGEPLQFEDEKSFLEELERLEIIEILEGRDAV